MSIIFLVLFSRIERNELMNKRKADRAAMRIQIREKYGLKQSKTDKDLAQKYGLKESEMDKELVQKILNPKPQKKTSLEKKSSLEKVSLTKQKEMARRYNITLKTDKEKCSIM